MPPASSRSRRCAAGARARDDPSVPTPAWAASYPGDLADLDQPRVGIDGGATPGVELEVQVRGAGRGVAAAAHVADDRAPLDVPGPHVLVGRQVRAVVLV